MPTRKTFWAKVVLKVLKAELAKREMTYNQLRDALALIGVKETETNIKNKFSRGTFSAIFFVQCLRAMGVKNLMFDETVFKEDSV
jgi:peptide subunit release factor RF-3